MANLITCMRIICSVALLFCRTLSIPFYVIYAIAGISDVIDGIVARKTGTVSESGSKLDTLADFVFLAVCLIKILPRLDVELWMYIWIGIVAVIKLVNFIWGLVVQKKAAAVHSILNRVTGGLLFCVPLSLGLIKLHYTAVIVCITATIAAIQEGHFIRTGRC